MSDSYTVDLPGSFDSYFSGTSIACGQTENDPEGTEAFEAYKNRAKVKRGRGYVIRITGSRTALMVFREYAENFVALAGPDFEYEPSELRGAKTAIERIDAVLKG